VKDNLGSPGSLRRTWVVKEMFIYLCRYMKKMGHVQGSGKYSRWKTAWYARASRLSLPDEEMDYSLANNEKRSQSETSRRSIPYEARNRILRRRIYKERKN
jgi:hypothetical protein